MRSLQTQRRSHSPLLRTTIATLALVLAACGSDESGSADGAEVPTVGGAADTNASGDVGAAGGQEVSGDAMATLMVGDEVHIWSAEQMTVCELDGVFGPANADFGVPPSQGGEGPWVQFIDRGDGGINFSAVIDGEQYSGTGGGAADEIRSDGFTYTGSMTRSGENVEVELEVNC